MKNEFMKILKESGSLDHFVKTNNEAIRTTREKSGDKNWKPEGFVVELAARLHLEFAMGDNEELMDAFARLADELAMREIVKELVKIANDNTEVE